jgi:hypothetical protein
VFAFCEKWRKKLFIFSEMAASILKQWLENDPKLCQVVKRVASFDEFVDDHTNRVRPLKQMLVVQKQFFVDGAWVPKLRVRDEYSDMPDNGWCCLFPVGCKNSFYVQDNKLHLSTSAIGWDIREEFNELATTGQVIQTFEQNERQHNLLFTLAELRELLQ